MTLTLNCPGCKAMRTIHFDHVKGTVTATCPRCGPGTTSRA